MAATAELRICIEEQLKKGKNRFVIYPFGETGMQVKNTLQEVYGLEPVCILDDGLCLFNEKIKNVNFLKQLPESEYDMVILASLDEGLYSKLMANLKEACGTERIAEIPSMQGRRWDLPPTKVGKYSYGPLCAHWLVESVGAFCSFAQGTDVVGNHIVEYVSAHPIFYAGDGGNPLFTPYETFHNHPWYFEDVHPTGKAKNLHRIKIGNDVWFGKNVTITNGANIGNGVFAGAGSIITKDVPDYAVVVGAPARIIKYRYTPEQIEALNQIAWWDWPDEKIRERLNDFYLPIEEFLKKYGKQA